MSENDPNREMFEAWLKAHVKDDPPKREPWKLEMAWKCDDERFADYTIEEYLQDKGPKHPTVSYIGGGAYISLSLILTPAGQDKDVLIKSGIPISLN